VKNFKLHSVLIFWFALNNLSSLFSQSSKFSYQLILETKEEYNAIDPNSLVNPDNILELNEINSTTQLYPIFTLNNLSNGINTQLQIEADIRNYDFEKERTDFFFQELYTQFSSKDKHYWTIGKKRLDWGSGMIWNPTNFFIQKDPLRTQNRLEGLFMINYTYLLKNHAFHFYLFPEEKKEDCSLALKYDFSKNRIDAGFSLVEYKKYQQFGYEFSYGGDQFTAYSEGVVKNYTKSYQVNETGELIEPNSSKKKFRVELAAGGMILLNDHFTFSCEYRFREDYLNSKEIAFYKAQLPSYSVLFDPISMGQHTFFGSMEYKDIYGRGSVNVRTFYDPVSRQLLISPWGIISRNNFQIELSVLFYNHSFAIYDFQSSILISYFFKTKSDGYIHKIEKYQ